MLIISGSFSAETSVRSPRKLFNSIIFKKKSGPKYLNNTVIKFENRNTAYHTEKMIVQGTWAETHTSVCRKSYVWGKLCLPNSQPGLRHTLRWPRYRMSEECLCLICPCMSRPEFPVRPKYPTREFFNSRTWLSAAVFECCAWLASQTCRTSETMRAKDAFLFAAAGRAVLPF